MVEKRKSYQRDCLLGACGALLMLAIILSLKTFNSFEKSIDARKLNDMEVDHVGNVQKNGEGFDFTWD